MRHLTIFSVFLFLSFSAFSQSDCKVLMESISGDYQGECKRGKAHGKGIAKGTDQYQGNFKRGYPHGEGTYTWANGDVYKGQWRKGQRDGKGTYTFKMGEKDSTLVGYWKNDEYIGKYKGEGYNIIRKYSVERVSFRRVGDENRVEIGFYQNGMANTTIENLMIVTSDGHEFSLGERKGYEQISFPFHCKVSYRTWNKLRTSQHDVSVEFEIQRPGHWIIDLHN